MKNKEKAFSLIEVVMALAILGIAILPILSMYPSALKMTTKATTNEEWSRVSMSIVDYVKSRGYKEVKLRLSGFNPPSSPYQFTYNAGYTSVEFASDAGITADSFVVNTKGIRLEDYEFIVNMEDLPISYSALDLEKNQIVSTSTNSSIIYGIVKIRKKGSSPTSFSDELVRDSKFIITPIEQWRD